MADDSLAPEVTASVTAYNTMPVGTVSAYASTVAPDGWLLCIGQTITSATYPNLYALIGSTVPDLRSRFIVGTGQGGGLSSYPQNGTGGVETVTLSTAQIPAHSHLINNGNFGIHHRSFEGNNDSDLPFENSGYSTYIGGTDNTGGGQSHENRPPYYALTYIIKF